MGVGGGQNWCALRTFCVRCVFLWVSRTVLSCCAVHFRLKNILRSDLHSLATTFASPGNNFRGGPATMWSKVTSGARLPAALSFTGGQIVLDVHSLELQERWCCSRATATITRLWLESVWTDTPERGPAVVLTQGASATEGEKPAEGTTRRFDATLLHDVRVEAGSVQAAWLAAALSSRRHGEATLLIRVCGSAGRKAGSL